MRVSLNSIKKPYIFGLATILFIVASMTVVTKPLFAPDENASQFVATEEESLPKDLDGIVTVQAIQELAQADGPGEPVEKIKIEQEDDQLYYLVGLGDGTLLAYDARSGESLSVDGKKFDDGDDKSILPANFKSVLNFSEARALGLKQVPGGIVKKIKYAVEDGVVVYSVSFKDGSRVDIDASDRKIKLVDVQSRTQTSSTVRSTSTANGNDRSSSSVSNSSQVSEEIRIENRSEETVEQSRGLIGDLLNRLWR